MQKIRVPINSFQFGEVSDSLLMRTDTTVYNSSAQRLRNMIVLAEGAVKKRHGLKHIHTYPGIDIETGNEQSHLYPFAFSNDEKYIVSVEDGVVRVFQIDNDDVTLIQVLTQDTDLEPLPFNKNYLQEYTVAQYGDVMFICHPLFMPRMLIRTGATSFEITRFTFDQRNDGLFTYQPYTAFQSVGVTLTPSATTGTVTLTTSADHWNEGHVGAVVRYGKSEIVITAYTSATQVTGDIVDELRIRLGILNPLRTKEGSGEIEVTHINHGYVGGESVTIEDASAFGGISTTNLNGTFTVERIIDENTWTYTAGASDTATDAEDGGGYVTLVTNAETTQWDEQSFSAVRGYPAAVAFHQNRLCFGGTISQPDTVWMSKTGAFFNFDVGEAADDDAINLVSATGVVNEIRYMVSNRDLQIFGAAGELYVPTFLNQAITPTNAQIRLQTPYGAEFCQPHSIDGATLFVQNGGNVVREFLYTDTEQAYTSTAVSTIASHLIDHPVCMTVTHGAFDGAESYAFISDGAGGMILFNSNRAEKRAAWTSLDTNGQFCSVCSVFERTFVNIWNPDGSLSLCEFTGDIGLDRYVTADVVSGWADVSSVYEVGDTLDVLSADGLSSYGQFTVEDNGGTASIDVSMYPELTEIAAGHAFDAVIISNPIDMSSNAGAMTGHIRAIAAAVVDFRESYSAKVNGRSPQLPRGFSGKKEYRVLGYSRDPQVTIEQTDPLPMQVNGIVAEVVV